MLTWSELLGEAFYGTVLTASESYPCRQLLHAGAGQFSFFCLVSCWPHNSSKCNNELAGLHLKNYLCGNGNEEQSHCVQ